MDTGRRHLLYDCHMRTIGDRLKEQRERAGLSLGQVAEYEATSAQYLWKLEKGENSPPTWPLLARLARRYRCSVDYLLGVTDDPLARTDAPMSGEVVALVESIAALPAQTMTMAVEVLAVIARHEVARRAAVDDEWNALRDYLSKLADDASVDAVAARLRDGDAISLAELLRLAQSMKEDEMNDAA